MGKGRESPLVGGVPGGSRVAPPLPGSSETVRPSPRVAGKAALGGQLCCVPVLSPRLEKATFARHQAT